jgi:transmembrane sensor
VYLGLKGYKLKGYNLQMSAITEKVAELLIRRLQEGLSDQKETILNAWRAESAQNEILFQQLIDVDQVHDLLTDYGHYKKLIWEKLTVLEPALGNSNETPVRLMGWRKYLVAASFLLVLSAGMFFWLKPASKPVVIKVEDQNSKHKDEDVAPGGNKALLVLDNGKTIVLDNAKNGQLVRQGNTQIDKQDGRLIYNAGINATNAEITYNTLKTPLGGMFHVTLSDGTEVFLNSISSLKYPTAFEGKERKVEITGEAYFEVSKDASRPFIVSVMPESGNANKRAEVEVLGTHFSIMAYPDEAATKATLMEGKIKVKYASATVILKPGQQAQLKDAIELKQDVDIVKEIAWKNGWFQFQEAQIQDMMRQLSRWYGVEIVYEGEIPKLLTTGKARRDISLGNLLKVLEINGVHFKIADKKIIVMP